MLESSAWRVLSLSARRVVERIEIELAHHGGKDNGALTVTYDDFVSYGIDRHAIAPAIREAVALGFIEVTERGRAGNAKWRSPNTFRITFRTSKGMRTDGTHEWRRISTMEAAEAVAKAARSRVGKNLFPSGGKRTPPVGETHTGNPSPQCGKPPLPAQWGKPTLLSISRGGVSVRHGRAHRRRPTGSDGIGGASA
jgi:hypothetical protein